jgi:uncharacterized protein YndB with AHSA1/START domain
MASSSNGAPQTEEHPLIITRPFNAPRELVWQAFVDQERLEQWWGRPGVTTRVKTLEVRPGGTFLYSQTLPDNSVMWGKWVYREIVPLQRLVSVVSFCDETGKIARAPFAPDWPLEMLSVATFTEHPGGTTITVEATVHNATAAERATFNAGRDNMDQGFNATYDRLDQYLASAQQSARH